MQHYENQKVKIQLQRGNWETAVNNEEIKEIGHSQEYMNIEVLEGAGEKSQTMNKKLRKNFWEKQKKYLS